MADVGAGKLISSVKKTDVIFHTKRALQEFSTDRIYVYYPYDILYLYPSKPRLYIENNTTHRRNYDDVKDLHEIVFDRDYDMEWQNVMDLALSGKINHSDTIKKLDKIIVNA